MHQQGLTTIVTDWNASQRTVCARFPEAAEVYLLGEFNSWSPTATQMAPVGGGLWEVGLPLKAALNQLRFLVRAGRPSAGQCYDVSGRMRPCLSGAPVG